MAEIESVTWSGMRTFLAVADHGSVRGAAAALHVTEPAVSAGISAAERRLGVDLLRRQGRGITLTEAGHVYAGYCRTVLGLLEESVMAVHGAATGRIRIGAVATASEYVLPPFLGRLRVRHPDVSFELTVGPRDELFSALLHHELDVVIAGRPPGSTGLLSTATRANQLVVVASPGLGEDVTGVTWLVRRPGSGTREATEGLFERLGSHPPTLVLDSMGAVLAAAREGLGVTLVHADAVAQDLADGRLVRVPVVGTPMSRPWHLVVGSSPVPAVALFLSLVTDPREVGDKAFRRSTGVRDQAGAATRPETSVG
jgi:DNA-binding transcriptional LysR family regulator